MLAIYRFDDKTGQLNQQSRISPGVWINVVDPTPAERQQLQDKAKLSEAFLLYGLDPDEGARYEYDEDNDSHLFIFDMPIVTRDARKKVVYETAPLAIIITNTAVITSTASRFHSSVFLQKVKSVTSTLADKIGPCCSSFTRFQSVT